VWAVCGFAFLLTPLPVSAQDSVIVLSKERQTRSRSVGEIVDFTGEALVLRHRSGREERIPPDRVVAIQSAWCTEHTQGDVQYDAGKHKEALANYLNALGKEKRAWVRRLILSRCVWCYRRLGQIERAGEAFLVIHRQDSETPYFDAIPLAWATNRPSPSLEQQARQWLVDRDSAVARLMGASWLLSTAERSSALRALRGLIDTPQPSVAYLSEAQSWRTRIVTADSTEADRWRERIERMPRTVRAGPYAVLGQLLARHHRHQEAALAFLRPAILYPQHHDLAAQSLLAAAGQLEELEQNDEAVRLYMEILTKAPQSPVVDDARRRMRELQPEGNDLGP